MTDQEAIAILNQAAQDPAHTPLLKGKAGATGGIFATLWAELKAYLASQGVNVSVWTLLGILLQAMQIILPLIASGATIPAIIAAIIAAFFPGVNPPLVP